MKTGDSEGFHFNTPKTEQSVTLILLEKLKFLQLFLAFKVFSLFVPNQKLLAN